MNIELTGTNFVSRRVSKDFTLKLETPAGTKTIVVNKWAEESWHDNDSDHNIIEGKDIYDSLSDEEQVEVDDFISELSLND